MIDKFKTYIYIFVFVVPCMVCFSFLKSNTYALADEYILDQSAFEVLEGGGGAYSNTYEFGLNADPNMVVFGVDSILQDINSKMYNKFGWDLEDAAWLVEDSFTDAAKSTLNRNLAAGATGFEFGKIYFTNAWNGTKNFILGLADDNTGKITSTSNNLYTYVDDSLINSMTSVKTDLVNDDVIINQPDLFYSTQIKVNTYDNYSSSQNMNGFYIYQATEKFFYYEDENSAIFVIPDNLLIDRDFCKLSCLKFSTSGQLISTTNDIRIDLRNTLFINNQLWYIVRDYYNLSSNYKYGSISSLSNIQNYITNNLNKPIGYSVSDYSLLKTYLDQLKNTWVTSDDLRQINEKIDKLTIGNIVIDGDTLPVIDTNADFLADIESLIEQILERNAEADEILKKLNQNEPMPDPIENVNQGIDIPSDLDSGLFNSVWDVLRTPFQTMSVFSPIFAIFGSGAAIFSLWLFLPSFIIILLVIWALK